MYKKRNSDGLFQRKISPWHRQLRPDHVVLVDRKFPKKKKPSKSSLRKKDPCSWLIKHQTCSERQVSYKNGSCQNQSNPKCRFIQIPKESWTQAWNHGLTKGFFAACPPFVTRPLKSRQHTPRLFVTYLRAAGSLLSVVSWSTDGTLVRHRKNIHCYEAAAVLAKPSTAWMNFTSNCQFKKR